MCVPNHIVIDNFNFDFDFNFNFNFNFDFDFDILDHQHVEHLDHQRHINLNHLGYNDILNNLFHNFLDQQQHDDGRG